MYMVLTNKLLLWKQNYHVRPKYRYTLAHELKLIFTHKYFHGLLYGDVLSLYIHMYVHRPYTGRPLHIIVVMYTNRRLYKKYSLVAKRRKREHICIYVGIWYVSVIPVIYIICYKKLGRTKFKLETNIVPRVECTAIILLLGNTRDKAILQPIMYACGRKVFFPFSQCVNMWYNHEPYTYINTYIRAYIRILCSLRTHFISIQPE